MERIIQSSGTIYTSVEEKAEVGSVFTMLKVVGCQANESVGPGMAENLLHTFSAWVKNLCQKQLASVLMVIVRIKLNLFSINFLMGSGIMNLGPYLVVGTRLNCEGVFASEVNSRRLRSAR